MNDLSGIILPENLPPPMVTCTVEGVLEEADLRELALSSNSGIAAIDDDDPADLKKVREKHHSVARMLAGGLTQRMVATLVGYNESYLSVLLNNPAMQELVQMYRIQNGAATQVITERLRTVGLKAVEKLDEKIEAGELNANELTAAAKLGLDRGGHGPTSTHHNIDERHVIDYAEIAKRNAAAMRQSADYIVPASEVRAAIAPPKEQTDETNRDLGEETPDLDADRDEPQAESDRE